jgi:hypothetical protein
MDEDQQAKEELLKQLEIDNQSHSDRAKAASKLCDDWQKANETLASEDLPSLTLKDYQESIDYKSDDALIFLAGVDDAWLKDYQQRINQREQASAAYYAGQPPSIWTRVSEFTRIVGIGVFIALFVGFIFLVLY